MFPVERVFNTNKGISSWINRENCSNRHSPGNVAFVRENNSSGKVVVGGNFALVEKMNQLLPEERRGMKLEIAGL